MHSNFDACDTADDNKGWKQNESMFRDSSSHQESNIIHRQEGYRIKVPKVMFSARYFARQIAIDGTSTKRQPLYQHRNMRRKGTGQKQQRQHQPDQDKTGTKHVVVDGSVLPGRADSGLEPTAEA